MSCIRIPLPSVLTDAAAELGRATDTMAALTGESCNLFGILGLGALEDGINQIFDAIGNAMAMVNEMIGKVEQLLNGIVEAALGPVFQLIAGIKNSIDTMIGFAQNAINQVTGMIDDALGLIAQKAGFAQIAACIGALGSIANFPPGVTSAVDKMNQLANGGTPVSDLANAMIADAKSAFMDEVNGKIDGLMGGIEDAINGAQNLIELDLGALGANGCS